MAKIAHFIHSGKNLSGSEGLMTGRLTVIFGLKSAFIEANFEANFEKNFVHSKNFPNFVTKIKHGALAHLARAFDWQSRGDEFESRMLHKEISGKPRIIT